jgi:hypothetical protein
MTALNQWAYGTVLTTLRSDKAGPFYGFALWFLARTDVASLYRACDEFVAECYAAA